MDRAERRALKELIVGNLAEIVRRADPFKALVAGCTKPRKGHYLLSLRDTTHGQVGDHIMVEENAVYAHYTGHDGYTYEVTIRRK